LLKAEGPDTLRNYIPNGRFIYYRDQSIKKQAARFDLTRPCSIVKLRLRMQGEGSATVHIFGGEGGATAPFIERDLVSPIVIEKSGVGIATVDVPLPDPLSIDDTQFFIVVDNLTSGLTLLSDETVKAPSCVSGSDAYYRQLIQGADGVWNWGKYSYGIDVILNYRSGTHRNLIDMTADSRIPDSATANGSIAWYDIDRDGYLDLMVGGKVFHNNGDESFSDVTASSGIAGAPGANLFVDINNDAAVDILFLGEQRENGEPTNTLFINNGDGRFTGRALSLAGIRNPTSFSLADINNDGFLDIFIGQSGISGRDTLGGALFLNDRSLGFTRDTSLNSYGQSHGSQWIDYDNDGYQDLYVADARYPQGAIWTNDGKGGLRALGKSTRSSSSYASIQGRNIGCSWGDYDNDGSPDLLLPWSYGISRAKAEQTGIVIPHEDQGSAHLARINEDFTYDANRAGGVWGDVNNDGLLDLVTTTACNCAGMDLYEQAEGQGFARRTFDYGLFGAAGGTDAVWVDYNNDGKLDLAFIEQGHFRLYKNQTPAGNSNFITLDLSKLSGDNRQIGARVVLYSGERRYTRDISSGRGALMQDPMRLHFGLGDAADVDSVVIRSPGGATGTFTGLRTNSINYLLPSGAAGPSISGSLQADAYPNPFATDLQISYQLPSDGPVIIEIYALAGEKVATVVDAKERAGSHVATWRARDINGSALPPGAYIYKVAAGGKEVHGRAVLTR